MILSHRVLQTVLPVLLVAVGAWPDPVFAQESGAAGAFRGGEVISAGGILQMATGLILVLVLIFGVAWFARRFGRFQGVATDQLRLIGGIHLGQRERIVVVQAGDARLVVGVSPGCIRTLHVMTETPQQVDSGDASARGHESFLERFNHEIRKRIRS